MRVRAPWLRTAILDDRDDGNYVIPNLDSVVLGGTHQHDWDTVSSKHCFSNIANFSVNSWIHENCVQYSNWNHEMTSNSHNYCSDSETGGCRVHSCGSQLHWTQCETLNQDQRLGWTETWQTISETGERDDRWHQCSPQLWTRGQWHHCVSGIKEIILDLISWLIDNNYSVITGMCSRCCTIGPWSLNWAKIVSS